MQKTTNVGREAGGGGGLADESIFGAKSGQQNESICSWWRRLTIPMSRMATACACVCCLVAFLARARGLLPAVWSSPHGRLPSKLAPLHTPLG